MRGAYRAAHRSGPIAPNLCIPECVDIRVFIHIFRCGFQRNTFRYWCGQTNSSIVCTLFEHNSHLINCLRSIRCGGLRPANFFACARQQVSAWTWHIWTLKDWKWGQRVHVLLRVRGAGCGGWRCVCAATANDMDYISQWIHTHTQMRMKAKAVYYIVVIHAFFGVVVAGSRHLVRMPRARDNKHLCIQKRTPIPARAHVTHVWLLLWRLNGTRSARHLAFK